MAQSRSGIAGRMRASVWDISGETQLVILADKIEFGRRVHGGHAGVDAPRGLTWHPHQLDELLIGQKIGCVIAGALRAAGRWIREDGLLVVWGGRRFFHDGSGLPSRGAVRPVRQFSHIRQALPRYWAPRANFQWDRKKERD